MILLTIWLAASMLIGAFWALAGTLLAGPLGGRLPASALTEFEGEAA